MISAELCRIVAMMPWQLKGPEGFYSGAELPGHPDMGLSLDDFSERYLHPLAQALVIDRKPPDKPFPFSLAAGDYEMNGCRVAWRIGYDLMADSHNMAARLRYRPIRPDRSLPVYFWIGELAEAV